jgi:Family of unknown function (DUF6088)
MSQLAETIMSAAHALPEGGLLSAKEFLHLASRAAVDQTLARLTREGKLMRVDRGAYAKPVVSRFGVRPPSIEAVVKAIESANGEVIVANGAAEANALGLTTQVPTRDVFLTSGRSRKLQLGSRTVELKHGNRWQLILGTRPAGRVIRALSWLGPDEASSALTKIHTKLPPEEWSALRSARSVLPSWMARVVSEAGQNV